MVMDVRDLISHDTYFDEFIILSGDADFTPLLHRLRAHARRTVVFANDHTAAPYTAIADGEIRESSLINLLLEGRLGATAEANDADELPAPVAAQASAALQLDSVRREILAEVVGWVKSAGQPVPLEALADRAVRTLGHDRTVGTGWAGAGSFMNLLMKGLPSEIRLSDQPPYYVFDASRQLATPATAAAEPRRTELTREPVRETQRQEPTLPGPATRAAPRIDPRIDRLAASAPDVPAAPQRAPMPAAAATPAPQAQKPAPRTEPAATSIQQSITRIHDACQAPPLAPPEYRALFEVLAQEINTNGLTGAQTLTNIADRAANLGVAVKRDDIRFVLEVVSETDPWFEQGASANLFSSRFRNFVIARCRSQGLPGIELIGPGLPAEELDLIDAWFGGSPVAQRAPIAASQSRPAETQAPAYGRQPQATLQPPQQADRWWSADEGRQYGSGSAQDDEMPLIVRNRLRG
mgnify:CR=1 FL=1